MPDEDTFRGCVGALDDVTAAFLTARGGLAAPSRYEADFAAFRLMEVVYRYVNSVSGIALLPSPGTHYVAAWVLLRAAFEVGVTAYWLTREDDWVEREARWLGWSVDEENFQKNLGSELKGKAPALADRSRRYADTLCARRLSITGQLPGTARAKRPKFPQLLRECGIADEYYVMYRIGSQFTHGSPVVFDSVFESVGDAMVTRSGPYSDWVDLLQLASWSVAQPGYTTLLRSGASREAVEGLLQAHDRLRERVKLLRRQDP